MAIFADIAPLIISEMDDAVETITYTPSGGSATSISAHVFREKPTDRNLQNEAIGKRVQISIYIKKTDVANVKLNNDTCTLKRDRGDTGTETFRVRDILKQDAGSYTLLVI